MKKVCFFTVYGKNGASSNYRILQFEKELNKEFETKYFSFWNDSYINRYIKDKKKYAFYIAISYVFCLCRRVYQLIAIAPKYDIVFFQKKIIPKSGINFLMYLKRRNTKIIFDVDDAIYINEKPRGFSSYVAKKSDIVIVGNDELEKYYTFFSSTVIQIPTVEYTPAYLPYKKNTYEKKIIGWIGTKSTINNLDLIVKPINELVQKYREIEFLIICDDDCGYLKKIKNSKFVKWKLDSYIKELSEISIGIMPLKNTKSNQGKCGFKLIQYLNCEKPVIASNVGINLKIVRNYGDIVKNDNWYELLEKYLFNEEYYQEKVRKIKKDFNCFYGYEVALEKIKKAIAYI